MIHIKQNNFQRDVYPPEGPEPKQFGEWQLCPKCNGNGFVLNNGTSTSLTNQCDVCNGAKIIQRPIIKP